MKTEKTKGATKFTFCDEDWLKKEKFFDSPCSFQTVEQFQQIVGGPKEMHVGCISSSLDMIPFVFNLILGELVEKIISDSNKYCSLRGTQQNMSCNLSGMVNCALRLPRENLATFGNLLLGHQEIHIRFPKNPLPQYGFVQLVCSVLLLFQIALSK